jgi:hypothetical protein
VHARLARTRRFLKSADTCVGDWSKFWRPRRRWPGTVLLNLGTFWSSKTESVRVTRVDIETAASFPSSFVAGYCTIVLAFRVWLLQRTYVCRLGGLHTVGQHSKLLLYYTVLFFH